jgi:hypothetical protein
VTKRLWLAATLAAAIVFGQENHGAEPSKPVFGFSSLRAMPEADARVRAETWLKSTNKFDQAKFDAIWSQANRSVPDRTLDSLLLGIPEAKELVGAARSESAPAPIEVPAVLKDKKLDPFVRANLAATYARALASRKVYEEALEAVKGIAPEQLVDPAAFYFYKAVAEHALIQREAAVASIVRLLDDVVDAPDRYRVVATLMFFDLQNWSKDEKDLTNIEKLMDNSGRRLDLARGGPKTQEIQKKIVFRLDEKIKELENRAKGQSQQAQGGQCPSGGQPGNNGSNNPSSPMQDSNIATNGGKGEVDIKKLRHYEENWGKLPESERQQIIQQVTRDLPAKYKPMIEDYFRSLNRMHGYRDR